MLFYNMFNITHFLVLIYLNLDYRVLIKKIESVAIRYRNLIKRVIVLQFY